MTDIAAVLKAVLPSLVKSEVERILASYPTPSDGKDGADGAPGPAGADGADGVPGPAGTDGKDGRGIVALDIRDGSLHVLYTDGTDQMVGRVVGDAGVAGKDADPERVAALVYKMMDDFREETKRQVATRDSSLERIVADHAEQIKSLTAADRELDTLSRDFIKGILTNA